MATPQGNHAGFLNLPASLLFRVVSRGNKIAENFDWK